MSQTQLYEILLAASFLLAIASLIALFYFHAPYGRWTSVRWGARIPGWVGWLVMETPAVLTIAIVYHGAAQQQTITSAVFLIMWEAHYLHRAFIYPFTRSDAWRPMPLAVPLMGIAFNVLNGWLNGYYLFVLSGTYPATWLRDPRFIVGLGLFVTGYVVNRGADRTLRQLRSPGELNYRIPQGGLYRWVSCPNYLGEIILWTGWAIATWSLPGLLFAVWTFANLAPRAISYHQWYHQHFEEYPANRKALIPFLW